MSALRRIWHQAKIHPGFFISICITTFFKKYNHLFSKTTDWLEWCSRTLSHQRTTMSNLLVLRSQLTYELQRLYWITSVTIYKPTILFVCNFIIWDKIWNTQDTPEDGRNGRAEEGQYEYWLFIIVGR